MLIPAPKLFWATAVLALAGLGVSFFDVFAGVWLTGLGALTAIAIVDAILALRLPVPKAERQTPGSLPLGVDQDIAIRLASETNHIVRLDAYDMHPPQATVTGLPQSVTIAAQGWSELRYRLRPIERGDIEFGRVQLRLHSPLGFWRVRRHAGQAESVRVYPDFAKLTSFALLAIDHRLSQIGVLQRELGRPAPLARAAGAVRRAGSGRPRGDGNRAQGPRHQAQPRGGGQGACTGTGGQCDGAQAVSA